MLAVTIYFKFDPGGGSVLFPKCAFYQLTGYQCPGCGTQRAVHSLLHGDLWGVWHYNAFLFVAVPLIVVYGYAEWRRTVHVRLYAVLSSRVAIYIVLALIIGWWVLRNVIQ